MSGFGNQSVSPIERVQPGRILRGLGERSGIKSAGLLLVLLLLFSTASVALPQESDAAGPRGKRVMVKEFVGNPNSSLFPPYNGTTVWWNPGWGGKGRGIKEAWVRFSVGGSAVECLDDVCGAGIGIEYFWQSTCSRPVGLPTSLPRYGKALVRANSESDSYSFVTAVQIRLPRPRKSCDVQAGIGGTEEFFYEDFGLYQGTLRSKIEVFVKK